MAVMHTKRPGGRDGTIWKKGFASNQNSLASMTNASPSVTVDMSYRDIYAASEFSISGPA